MIFGPELVGEVLDGTKTVTRRRVTHRDGRDLRYRAGKVYAIQPGRGKPHVGHIRIRSVSVESLGDIRLADIEAEGFNHPCAFVEYWKRLYGHYDPKEAVAVISFELAPRCPKCASWP